MPQNLWGQNFWRGRRIIQISSMGGQIAFPLFSLRTKASGGIEECFQVVMQEVARFGIQATLVKPCGVKAIFLRASAILRVANGSHNCKKPRHRGVGRLTAMHSVDHGL